MSFHHLSREWRNWETMVTVTSYTSFCQDLCIPPEDCQCSAKDKPWYTRYLKFKLKEKEDAFKMSKERYGEQRLTICASFDGQFLSNDTRTL